MDDINASGGAGPSTFGHSATKEEFLFQAEACLKENASMAVNLAQDWLAIHPDDIDARLVLGSAWTRSGQREQALQVFKSVADDVMSLSIVFKYLGDLYLEKEWPDEARNAYQHFIALNTDSPISREVSEILFSLEESPEKNLADGETGTIAEISPDFHTITLAELYITQGHLGMAKNIIEDILLKDPANLKALQKSDELKVLLEGASERPDPKRKQMYLLNELNRWLRNLEKMNRHAL